MKNNRGKFQLNPVHGFRENGHNHLYPIRICLKIRDVGLSKFWCGDALEWWLLACKISAQPSSSFGRKSLRKFPIQKAATP